jgi:putative aldouronate transport system substrate-binding protein
VLHKVETETSTDLDIRWVPDGIYSSQLSTAMAADTLMMATCVSTTHYPLMKNAIRGEQFWEIGPYLKEYPHLKRLNQNTLQSTSVDGKYYGLFTERPSSRQGIILRKDWLEQLGLEEPHTIDALYQVLKAFAKQDPDGNGTPDTVGLVDRNDLVFGAFKTLSSYFGTPNNWGLVDGKLLPEFETKAYVDTMDFMKTLFDEQLINREFAVTSKNVQRDQFVSGKAGVYIGSMEDAKRMEEEAKQLNPDARFTLVNDIQGPEGLRVWAISNYSGLYLFSKKAIPTEEALRKALHYFDQSMGITVSNLLRHGIEGRHYVLEEGKVVVPDSLSEARVQEVLPLQNLVIAELSNTNLLEVKESHPLMEKARELVKANEKFIVRDPTASLESKTFDERGLSLQDIIDDATYHYILGKIDEQGFRDAIGRWYDEGGRQIVEEYNLEYDRFRGNQ